MTRIWQPSKIVEVTLPEPRPFTEGPHTVLDVVQGIIEDCRGLVGRRMDESVDRVLAYCKHAATLFVDDRGQQLFWLEVATGREGISINPRWHESGEFIEDLDLLTKCWQTEPLPWP